MTWFQNSKENNDLADKLYELLSSSNSTLKNVHESFEKLWKEINDSKLEMAKFSTEVNGELNAINKSIDSLTSSVKETERSMSGNNGTKGMYVRMNHVEEAQASISDGFRNLSNKLDNIEKSVIGLEGKIKNKEREDTKKDKFKSSMIVTGFSGSVIFLLTILWKAAQMLIAS